MIRRVGIAPTVVSMVLALAIAWARPAGASAESTIAVVTPAGSSPLTRRIHAELEASGFRVVMVNVAGTPEQSDALPSAAQRVGAVAAIQVNRSRAGVRIWIADRVTGKTVMREVGVPRSSAESIDALVAVRVVELLRSSFLELEASHRSRGEVEPSPAVRRLVAEQRAETPTAQDAGTTTIPARSGGVADRSDDQRFVSTTRTTTTTGSSTARTLTAGCTQGVRWARRSVTTRLTTTRMA